MSLDRKFAAPVANAAGGPSFGNAAAVTPSDTVPLSSSAAALYVGVAGNVTVITINQETVTFSGVAAGTVLPIATAQVKATGTTATSIVALW